jgi:hypothetical protein
MRLTEHAQNRRALVQRTGGRGVWVMDSIAFGSPDLAGEAIVTGSHGGASAGEYALRFGVAVMVCNDAGCGKNDAGVAGINLVDGAGIVGIAVGHDTARIGDGLDAWENGVITHRNNAAVRLGVEVGQPLSNELDQLLLRVEGLPLPTGRDRQMRRQIVGSSGGTNIVVMDSMSQVEQSDRGSVVIAASNAGQESGKLGAAAGCALVVLNDAGVGKDRAGLQGLLVMEQAGIPCAAVSHNSAEISDGMDTWTNGVISHANGPALKKGLTVGRTVRRAVRDFLFMSEKAPLSAADEPVLEQPS